MRTFYSLRVYLILASLFTVNLLYADNKDKLRIHNSHVKEFFSFVFNNPANMPYYSSLSYSEINSGWILDNRKNGYMTQEGDKESAINFNALSYLKKNNKTFFGSLFYNNGERKNVRWTQTSDYKLLYPYVIVNKKVIDIDFEKYSFSGGYAFIKNKIGLGIWGKYSAQYEYSTSDPRPQNIVSKYDVRLGLTGKLTPKYVYGISIEAQSYKQKNDIKIFKEITKSEFYYMRGFGLYNFNFLKNERHADCLYNGIKYGAEIQLLPLNKHGFYSSVGFNIFNFDQDIPSEKDITLYSMKNTEGYVNIGYKPLSGDNSYCFKAYGKYKKRQGKENIYAIVSSSNYLLTTSHEKYSENNIKIGLSSLANFNQENRISYWLKANAFYCFDNIEYIEPVCKQKITTGKVYLSGGINAGLKKSYLDLHLSGGYHKNINSEIIIPVEGIVDGIGKGMLMHNYRYLASNKMFANINLRYDYYISETKTIFLKGNYKIERIKDEGSNRIINIAIGLTF
jgi:hypothetical protein